MKRLLGCALLLVATTVSAETKTAVFAGGCFWCIEADFEKLPGVIAVESGYTGGTLRNPTYQQVSVGGTGHAEAVRVSYDAEQVSYAKLLDYFWRHIDPTVKDQQFCDVGSQYRSAVFYQNKAEQASALASKQALQSRFANIYTEIVAASTFYPAETYHQDYYRKNPLRYQYYRYRCGRDERVKAVWGTR
ncbi:MAG: peptide-methionine (S)-S-oxide reductase [Gallionellales bacterium CG03_land_8_20_14_0_80_55_15]|nr:MAG: peptide-methionine (S)-S-oxide reductase [Gallionellales bacterium CG03_land_8_20_14_0_80_55_15]PIX04989.1 MAG: peptide-methionine (S)-S-oxide reductase [Gallionellales bacterium CG_4_8_14_3_um_filter_54_18]PJC05492.1 MAG: peptide-methionine (S)-S-oxide reductase [Gallionellales bacterium CG_4_9_14_0_8_um_filter_55_61]